MRITALDSLRGVAAFSVVIYHCLLVSPVLNDVLSGKGVPLFRTAQDPLPMAVLMLSPPSLLWSGREAVLLFFVLSGYVLAQGFLRRPQPWLPFVLRRACRLLLPCIAMALLVTLLVVLVEPAPRPGHSKWVDMHWTGPPTVREVVTHALLLELPYALNTPLWTLHYEWRISLIFPALMLLAAAGPAVALVVCLGGAAAAVAELRLLDSEWLSFLLYLPHFLIGILLARQGASLPRRIARLPGRARIGLWALCYLLLDLRWLLPAPGLVLDLLNGLGAALLIALVLASPRAQALLAWRPLAWLGQVSFSLYLVHVPVILAALHLAPPELPVPVALGVAVALSLPLAWGLFHLVEAPAMRLGRVLDQRLGAARGAHAAGTAASR